MFYGRGAGADATASAVVADIVNIAKGPAALAMPEPWMPADSRIPVDFGNFAVRSYLAVSGADLSAVRVIFGDDIELLEVVGETAFLTKEMTENEMTDKLSRLAACGGKLLSRIRVL
jgi:homoserine dehydrogenase